MEKKFIYPEVRVILEVGTFPNKSFLSLESYIRLVYRKKYYLTKSYRLFEISDGVARDTELISCINQFYSEIYRHQNLMWVNLNMVTPGNYDPPKPVFELDPDQTPEAERLME